MLDGARACREPDGVERLVYAIAAVVAAACAVLVAAYGFTLVGRALIPVVVTLAFVLSGGAVACVMALLVTLATRRSLSDLPASARSI